MEEQLEARDIVNRTLRMIERNMGTALLVLLALAANGVAIDFVPDTLRGVPLLVSLPVYLTAQYVILRRALASEGVQFANRKGLGTSFCGASIVTSLLSALALLLVIVPGVYLYLRWSIATPAVLAEGLEMDPAMRASAERTEGNRVPIGLAQLILNLPWLVGMWLGTYGFGGEGPLTLPASALCGVLIGSGYVASWFCMVATYLLLEPRNELEEVFA